MGTKTEQISVTFARLADLGVALDAVPLSKFPNCWEHKIDDHWEIFINGHKEPKQTTEGTEVQPFHCYIKFNGWPAGFINPYGGIIAAGEIANEDTFIAAIEAKIKLKGATR